MSRSSFYSLRKRKALENSKESPMCNHPYFAGIISRDGFRRRGIRPLGQFGLSVWYFTTQPCCEHPFCALVLTASACFDTNKLKVYEIHISINTTRVYLGKSWMLTKTEMVIGWKWKITVVQFIRYQKYN